jgi:hypothetical protein
MIFTIVLQWSIFVASKNDLDDQNLLLATVLSCIQTWAEQALKKVNHLEQCKV